RPEQAAARVRQGRHPSWQQTAQAAPVPRGQPVGPLDLERYAFRTPLLLLNACNARLDVSTISEKTATNRRHWIFGLRCVRSDAGRFAETCQRCGGWTTPRRSSVRYSRRCRKFAAQTE